ncbi:MAG: ABC transporter substrate-binding protein [Halanaeroarchaeum sp.]
MTSQDQASSRANRRQFLKYVGGTSVAVGLAGCSGNGGDGTTESNGTTVGTTGESVDEVVLGSHHPLSGGLASTGSGMSNALKLAAQRKNEEGGIESLGGAEVTVIEGDNKGQQELGGEVSNNLIDEGADILLGSYSSPVTTAATQVAERQQVPFVITVAADDSILQGRGLNYVYRPQPPAKQIARDYADLVPEAIRNDGGTIETAGLYYVNNSYGQAIKDHLNSFLPEQDVEVVAETAIEYGASDANTQATKLKQADPDTIIATTYVPGGVILAKALQDIGYRPKYLTASASATFTDEDAIADIGEFANGVMDNNYALNPTIDKTAEVKEQFREQYEQDFSATVGMAYTSAEVAIAGIEAAGSTDSEAINQALKGLSYEDHIAAMGPVEFEDNGENKNALAPVNQVQDMEVKVVYPEQFAEAEPQL